MPKLRKILGESVKPLSESNNFDVFDNCVRGAKNHIPVYKNLKGDKENNGLDFSSPEAYDFKPENVDYPAKRVRRKRSNSQMKLSASYNYFDKRTPNSCKSAVNIVAKKKTAIFASTPKVNENILGIHDVTTPISEGEITHESDKLDLKNLSIVQVKYLQKEKHPKDNSVARINRVLFDGSIAGYVSENRSDVVEEDRKDNLSIDEIKEILRKNTSNGELENDSGFQSGIFDDEQINFTSNDNEIKADESAKENVPEIKLHANEDGDELPIVHYMNRSRKSYSHTPCKKYSNISHSPIALSPENKINTPKKSSNKKITKRKLEQNVRFNKMAEVMNSKFKEIDDYRLIIE